MADDAPPRKRLTRRQLLIGGGAGVGLIVAWAVWPRRYAPNLAAAEGEHIFNAWLKIGEDGHVTVAVPQAEHGQGVWTTLPQIVADELGADWRTIAVEPAPLNPLYANQLAVSELFEGAFDQVPQSLREGHVTRAAMMITAGSTSIRQFEDALRDAGAAARVLLQRAAARRWNTDWQACGTAQGFVVRGKDRLRFGELAAEAAKGGSLPDPLPLRGGEAGRLTGQSLQRLDSPAKIDGSVNFAADIRLPDMLFAAIRQGPTPGSRLSKADRAAANKVFGMRHVVDGDNWVAAVANNWWAANKGLEALKPQFAAPARLPDDYSIRSALDGAFSGNGVRIASQGDVGAAFRGKKVVAAQYRADPALHASIEPRSATAAWTDGMLEVWLPTLAPGLARAAIAAAMGVGEGAVVIHTMPIGGGFGIGLESDAGVQAAAIARAVGHPIQLTWSRVEDCLHDCYRAPAMARMTAQVDQNGRIAGWLAKVAAPATGREMAERLLASDAAAKAALALPGGDGYAVAGAVPFYQIPNWAVDHHPAEIGIPTGHWRSGAHSYTCFFNESFIDELAHVAGTEAMSFRIAMLGGDARLARCLTTVAALGGWEGGVAGSGQGIACHSFRGSHIAVFAEAHIDEDQSIGIDRIVAAVDCGRQINPDVVRQNIESGLVFGMAQALGCSTGFKGGIATAHGFGDLDLPVMADMPDVTVELIRSEADPGGVSELAVPPVAPAIANALQSATGFRIRTLPLRVGEV